MGQLTVAEYDALERAIVDARRIRLFRRGTEFLVVPEKLVVRDGREAIIARHPTTGAALEILLEETDRFEVVR
ncbi:MAG: hypothetical protein KJZ74_08245 [Gemmatimonadales bacterium]|nr:hypothetical protein [Gemmatimonadota bacterium]MCL4213889.1 hypothetical protein [Gemmatimonadales bacterium]